MKKNRLLVPFIVVTALLVISWGWMGYYLFGDDLFGSNTAVVAEDGWEMMELSMFKGKVLVKPEIQDGSVRSLTVKVSKGQQILAPVDCEIGQAGGTDGSGNVSEGFVFYKNEEALKAGNTISFDFNGSISYEHDRGQMKKGTVLGSFPQNGVLVVIIDKAGAETNDPVEWYEKAMSDLF